MNELLIFIYIFIQLKGKNRLDATIMNPHTHTQSFMRQTIFSLGLKYHTHVIYTQNELLSIILILLQSAEEIERLTVDEQLSDIERAVYLLR